MRLPGPDVSVVVPVSERPHSLVQLYHETMAPLHAAGYSVEFVFVAYRWWRPLTDALGPLVTAGEPIRIFELSQGLGETALVKVGVTQSTGRVVLTVPAYPQVDPAGAPALVETVRAGADLAVARRWPRQDSLINRAQNRVLHLLIGRLGGDRVHDVACGLRAMRRDLLLQVAVYGDFVRFLPVLALREGLEVEEVAIPVHPGAMRGRVYSPGVYLRRLFDVLGLIFLARFTDKPLRFFGLLGTSLAALGGLILLVVFVQRFAGQPLADRPVLVLGVLLVTLGAQSVALGLIGEMIVHLSVGGRSRYRIRETHSEAVEPRHSTELSGDTEARPAGGSADGPSAVTHPAYPAPGAGL